MRKVLLLLLAFSLFTGGKLLAQAAVSIANQTACIGDTAFVAVQLNTSGQAIGAASLVIRWDSTAVFRGIANVLPVFAPDFSWQQQGRTVRVSWFSTTPITLNGSWFQLRFSGNSAAISFSTVPGENELANAQGLPLIGTSFQPGQLTFQAGSPTQISSQPRDTLAVVGAQVTFRVIATNATVFGWERSTDGGNNWTILSNDATYSTTTTAILGVSNVTAAMQGDRFRARLSSSCQSLLLSQSALLSVQQPGSTLISLTANPVCGQDTAIVNVQAGAALNGVGAISLVFLHDSTQAQFVQISSPLAGLSNGLLTNRVGNRLFVSWFNTSGINIPQGTFLQLRFRNVSGGTVSFDQSLAGNNELSNLTGIAFPLALGSVQLQSAATPQAVLAPSGTINSCSGAVLFLNATTATGFSYRWLRNNLPVFGAISSSFQPFQSGAYRVIVTNAAGCFDTSATTTVNISAAINAQITPAGSTTFCTGGSVLLNATVGTGFTYSWFLNGVAISGANAVSYTALVAGAYRVRVQNSNNCVDTSLVVTVVVNARPVAGITAVGATSFCPGGSVTLNATTGTGFSFIWQRNGVIITGANTSSIQATLAGDYRVIISASGGCSDTSGLTSVTLLALPAAQLTAGGATTFCAGDSVQLNANTGTGLTYSWLRNDTLIAGQTTATLFARVAANYKVRVSNAAGCVATSSAISTTVTPLPAAPALSVRTDTIFSSVSTGLLWFRNGLLLAGLNDSLLVVTQTGHYTALRSVGNCQSDSSNTILIDNVSLESLARLQFKLYPNPTEGRFYVDFTAAGLGDIRLRLYNVQGKLVQEVNIGPGSTEQRHEFILDAAAGLYFVELEQGGKKGYQRLMLRH